MSAELLNLLRHGASPLEGQAQHPTPSAPASLGSPSATSEATSLPPSSTGNPALDLLFRDMNLVATAPPMSLYSPAPVNQGASLLSLLQGQPLQGQAGTPEHPPEPPVKQEEVEESVNKPEEKQADALWKLLQGQSESQLSPSEPAREKARAELEPSNNTSSSIAGAAHPVPTPSQSQPRSPFEFFSGFDVLAARNHQHSEQPSPRSSPATPRHTSKPVMRVSSPLRPASPAARPDSPSSLSRNNSRQPQQRAPKRAVSNAAPSADSPGSSAPASPGLAKPRSVSGPAKDSQQASDVSDKGQDVPDLWLSAQYLDQLPSREDERVGVPVSAPKYDEQEQAIHIDISEPSLDLIYRGSRSITPITLFQTPHAFGVGRKLDLLQSIIIYATRTGRLRILDRSSGARLLLKGHSGPVTDVCLNDLPGSDNNEDILVISASVSAPSVILWKVARDVAAGSNGAYASMPAGFRALLEFSLKTPDASVRCIRKLTKDLFALATTDSRLLLLDLASSAWSDILQRDDKKMTTEEELMGSGLLKQVKFGDPVVDLTVSPDASAVIVLDAAGHLHIGEITAERSLKPKRKAQFIAQGLKPEQIALLSYPGSSFGSHDKGFFVAISYDEGRTVHLNNMQGQVLTSITLTQPQGDSLPKSFGRLSYNSTFSTLMLSSSLRGSVYAFHVRPAAPAEPLLLGTGGRDLDWLVHAATSPRASVPSARISGMLELSCPKHTLEYVDATAEEADASLFCVALDGISQVHIDSHVLYQLTQQSADEDLSGLQDNVPPNEAPRGVNFKDAIAVEVDEVVDTDRESQTASPGPSARRKLSSLPVEIARQPPFSSSLKERSALSRTNSSTEQGQTTTQTATEAVPLASSMSEELQGLEERLFARVEKLITDREAAAERRAREERATEQAAEITRQEKLLGMVSQTLSKQTNRTLDQSIRSEIRESVMPAISQTVKESVETEISTVLRNSLQRSIPDALSGFFNRPDVTNHLIRSFSSSASPIIERMVQDTVRNTVVPHFTRETQHMIDVLSKQMHGEIMTIRKDIESENNAVIAELTDNIAHLKEMLQQAELKTQNPVAPPPPPSQHWPTSQVARGAPQSAAHYSPAGQIQSQQPQPQSARSSTPVTAYEDILLEALASQDDARLTSFIEEHSDRRIRAIFHSGAKPPISQPVLLSLMHRLVKPLAQRPGPLDNRDYVRIRWFRACLDGLDYDDDQTMNYVPRVLEVTCNALSSAQARLMSVSDMQGMNTVNDLVNTLQYLLKARR